MKNEQNYFLKLDTDATFKHNFSTIINLDKRKGEDIIVIYKNKNYSVDIEKVLSLLCTEVK